MVVPLAVATIGIVALVTLALLVAPSILVDRSGSEIRYVIPAGTAERIERGEYVEIVPLNLTLQVGDRVTVVNQDDRPHTIGLFSVRPGETTTYRFSQPGRFIGDCSVHTGKQVLIIVT